MFMEIRNLVCFPIFCIGANLVAWYLIKGGLMERLEEIYMDL